VTYGPRRVSTRRLQPLAFLALALAAIGARNLVRAQVPAAPDTVPGERFVVEEPITSETFERLKAASKALISRNATQGKDPVLVFEFRPGKARPGGSDFGPSYDLANLIARDLVGGRTVAYVPEPLKGYAVLPALACQEIVMGSRSSLGPITPEGSAVRAEFRELVRNLAVHTGRDPGLFLGMLDRDADLRVVRTADKQIHYLMADGVDEFARTHQILSNDSAWAGGQRGVLPARTAREQGFTKLLSDDIAEVFNAYRLSASLASDPSLLADPKAVWIKIEGRIDAVKKQFVEQRVQKARIDGVNLIFFEVNSEGGLDLPASAIAQQIAEVKDIKTVAFVNDRALGVAALIPLACDDIVLRSGARIGDVTQIMTGGRDVVRLAPKQVAALTMLAGNLSQARAHPVAVGQAMVDPDLVVVSAKDSKTGGSGYFSQLQVDAEPGRYLDVVRVKEPGQVLTLTADAVAAYGLGRAVAGEEDLKALYRLRGKPIRVDGPTWVDGLVQTLNDPFVSFVLLFVGIFMLILEVKMPGVGLPAIASVLAFVLFFWSRFLSGTADQLEIILFVVGLICLGLELFVFPGFGVFGVSGVLLILVSIIMASHTFVWPTQEYEYRQMLSTLFQVTAVLVSVGVGIAFIGRFLPKIPLFNRMILTPEPWDGVDPDDPLSKPVGDSESSLSFLMGETGRTTTALRPTGKARFGELLVDVTADGFYIEPDTLVEVIEVQGPRVVVRAIR
jgi:membrane-bound serine protease (ClpP class)